MTMTTGPGRFWRVGRILGLLLVLVAVAIWSAGPVKAQDTRSVEWKRFDVALTVKQDGAVHVAETQQITFSGGSFSKGFADIPLGRIDGVSGVKVSEIADDGTVIRYDYVDEANPTEPETYTWGRNGAAVSIDYRFESAVNETRTFLIEYDVRGVIRVYPDLDPPNEQLWWIAVSKETTETAPVDSSTVTMTLPEAVPLDQVQVISVDGTVGDPADFTTDGKTFTWTASNLTSGDQLEVRLQFPMILDIAPPAWQQTDDASREAAEKEAARQNTYGVIFAGIAILGAIVGGIGLFSLWYLKGRDPHAGLVASFLPEPPDDLPPGAAGALVDERAEERDLVATIVDLGRRGVFQIDDVIGAGGSDLRLTMKTRDVPMQQFEKDLVGDLFNGDYTEGKQVTLQSGALSEPDKIEQGLYSELVARGYYTESPEATRRSYGGGARVLMIIGFIGLFAGPALFSVALAWLPFAVLILLGLALRQTANAMPQRTEKGSEAHAKWQAFKRYLEDIQKYEKIEESTAIFDKYLPFAVAFGIDKSWVNKFAQANTPMPSWFGPVIINTGNYRRNRIPNTGGGTIFGSPVQGGSSGGGGGGGIDLPDFGGLQGWSDSAARNLQTSSDSLADILNSAGGAFAGFGSSGGSRRSSGSFGSRGGGSRGFSGGGSRGGGSGGGRRGFG